MRWLKHLTAAHRDEKLAAFLDECGLEGYGFWWLLLEVVGHVVKGSQCDVTYSLPQWSRLLYSHHHRVSKYMGKLHVAGLIVLSEQDSKLRVAIPNLLKYRDEYARKSGQAPAQTPDDSPESLPPQKQKQIQKQKREEPSPAKPSAKDQVEGLSLDDDLVAYAKRHGVRDTNTLADVLEDWRLFCRSKGYRTTSGPIADARSSFMRWIRNAKNFTPKAAGSLFNRPPRRVDFGGDD